jgi:hypothetical protein
MASSTVKVNIDFNKTERLLEKQLELLSEQSQECSIEDLAVLSHSMAEIANSIILFRHQIQSYAQGGTRVKNSPVNLNKSTAPIIKNVEQN